jgi:hypothetical protein
MDPFTFRPFVRSYYSLLYNLKNDYKIMDRYVDGYDKYGPKYRIETVCGWSGWDWLLEKHVKNIKEIVRDDIKNHGFVYRGTTYYFNHQLLDYFYNE